MFTEDLSLTATEENLLRETIGKKLLRISTMKPIEVGIQALLPIYADFGDFCFEVTRTDEMIQYFDIREDAGRPTVSKAAFSDSGCIKTINRVVQDVLVVIDTFEFSNYKVTYPKSIIFQFDDCNLVMEKIWLISLGELDAHLEPPDAENYGLTDEMQFWYDPAEDDEKPLATQKIKSLKQGGFID
ncbi:MAG: hypothetical protein IKI76_04160 [Selenomonadaceae bacterium]|nr:hypothetical protein [Selenomonadaceae bacterium]